MSQLSDHPPEPPRRPVGAIVLIAIGLLILVPSGLCTGVMGLVSIFYGNLDMLGIALQYGGLPLIFGFILLSLGLKMPRK